MPTTLSTLSKISLFLFSTSVFTSLVSRWANVCWISFVKDFGKMLQYLTLECGVLGICHFGLLKGKLSGMYLTHIFPHCTLNCRHCGCMFLSTLKFQIGGKLVSLYPVGVYADPVTYWLLSVPSWLDAFWLFSEGIFISLHLQCEFVP